MKWLIFGHLLIWAFGLLGLMLFWKIIASFDLLTIESDSHVAEISTGMT